jgi:hypothetical protein
MSDDKEDGELRCLLLSLSKKWINAEEDYLVIDCTATATATATTAQSSKSNCYGSPLPVPVLER